VLPAPYADAVAFWSGVELAVAQRESASAERPLASARA
jgi:hypothetical protein